MLPISLELAVRLPFQEITWALLAVPAAILAYRLGLGGAILASLGVGLTSAVLLYLHHGWGGHRLVPVSQVVLVATGYTSAFTLAMGVVAQTLHARGQSLSTSTRSWPTERCAIR
ncbi:MAG: hypothetical protein K6V73_08470 [Firmicutes bacterium]|nr:hypothetical protein [Bacillota bacterium]